MDVSTGLNPFLLFHFIYMLYIIQLSALYQSLTSLLIKIFNSSSFDSQPLVIPFHEFVKTGNILGVRTN